jgi:peroxiredoxin
VANTNPASRKGQTRPPEQVKAPAIELPAGHGWTWALQDFQRRPVILVFYPADWEPVSSDQLRTYDRALPQIHQFGAELVGVSVDSIWCHEAFARELRLRFRLLSDFQPRGGAARAYGVYRPGQGTSARALFVIDATGFIWWHYLAAFEVNPGVDGILTALERLVNKQGST